MSDTRPIPWPWKGEQSPIAMSDAPVLIRRFDQRFVWPKMSGYSLWG